MGSTSGSIISCFQCRESSSNSDHFKNGWRLRNGEFAKLCFRCACIYNDGKFCETFHSQEDGWRDCESCGKLVHCGCIASFNTHMLLDFGGVICMQCTRINLIQARHQSLPVEMLNVTSDRAPIEPQYLPHCTADEIQAISRNPDSQVIPLFEKQLTNSDADSKLARLVLPKRCAETHFPHISDPRGFLFRVYDVEGKAWDFVYRYWVNNGSKMYILDGLKEFMTTKRWQAGDTVTFYRIDPPGSFVIGLRKKLPIQPANEVAMDTSESSGLRGSSGGSTRKIKGVQMKRVKNVWKKKAIAKAISRSEKSEVKVTKTESKIVRIKSAKKLYD